jgi:hypothetical protein
MDDFRFKSQQGHKIFLFNKMLRPGCGAHPASYSVGMGLSFLVVKSLGHEPEHLHLVLRLMNGAAPPLPLMPSWFMEGQLYFFDYSNEPLLFIKGRILS